MRCGGDFFDSKLSSAAARATAKTKHDAKTMDAFIASTLRLYQMVLYSSQLSCRKSNGRNGFFLLLDAECIERGAELLQAGFEHRRVATDAEPKMLRHFEEFARDHRGFELVAQEFAEIIRRPVA